MKRYDLFREFRNIRIYRETAADAPPSLVKALAEIP
jgi:hypothetical protein